MSELNMMPLPILQMGMVEKVAVVEQTQPHVQQLVAQETARQALKAEAERVPQVNSSEHGRKVREREAGQERKGNHSSAGRTPEKTQEAQESAPDEDSHSCNPWAGQIVNVKV